MTEAIDYRYTELTAWLSQQITDEIISIKPLIGDASFRRYFRVQLADTCLIAMDAPPDKEACGPFVAIAKLFAAANLTVPHILAEDLEKGFLLITDLGDELYYQILNTQNASHLYGKAIEKLLLIQTCKSNQNWQFPPFSKAMLMEELARFRKWYLLTYLKLDLKQTEETVLQNSFDQLVQSAVEQPQVCVHRDYHSRNLLDLPNDVGILDFQDAVWGPVTYDLVSLIRDCYIDWPAHEVASWASAYYKQAVEKHILMNISFEQFMRWFDWMGMQRHLKAIYIFARKYCRDGTPAYLKYIPRALNYVLAVSAQYPEFYTLHQFLLNRVLPYESDDTGCRPRTAATSAH